MSFHTSVTLDQPFDLVVARVRDGLAEQGFGVLTEIDVKATLKAKLDADIEDYLILGACNPPLAQRALEVDRAVGLLLPCNVVVRATEAGTVVDVLDPQTMVPLTGLEALRPVADDAAARLTAMVEGLK